jgi:hypothetical protein
VKRISGSASRLLLGVAASSMLASALLLSAVGFAAASSTPCVASANGSVCNLVATSSGSSYTVLFQRVTVHSTGFEQGYVHFGVIINGNWQDKSVSGLVSLVPGQTWTSPNNYSTSLCYSSSNRVQIYSYWQATWGGDPDGPFAEAVTLPA